MHRDGGEPAPRAPSDFVVGQGVKILSHGTYKSGTVSKIGRKYVTVTWDDASAGQFYPHALTNGEPAPTPSDHPDIPRYLSRAQIARYLGLKSVHSLANNGDLPEPDVLVGTRRGWSPATIDAWRASRPGSGRWGAR